MRKSWYLLVFIYWYLFLKGSLLNVEFVIDSSFFSIWKFHTTSFCTPWLQMRNSLSWKLAFPVENDEYDISFQPLSVLLSSSSVFGYLLTMCLGVCFCLGFILSLKSVDFAVLPHLENSQSILLWIFFNSTPFSLWDHDHLNLQSFNIFST